MYSFLSCTTQKAITRSQDHKITTSQHNQIQLDEKANQTTRTLDQQVIALTYSDSFVDIVPRGPFRISPDGSFEGQAAEVRIHHRDSSRREANTKVDLSSSDSSASFSQIDSALSSESNTEKFDKQVKRKPNFGLYIGLAAAILIVIAGLRLFSKFKLF